MKNKFNWMVSVLALFSSLIYADDFVENEPKADYPECNVEDPKSNVNEPTISRTSEIPETSIWNISNKMSELSGDSFFGSNKQNFQQKPALVDDSNSTPTNSSESHVNSLESEDPETHVVASEFNVSQEPYVDAPESHVSDPETYVVSSESTVSTPHYYVNSTAMNANGLVPHFVDSEYNVYCSEAYVDRSAYYHDNLNWLFDSFCYFVQADILFWQATEGDLSIAIDNHPKNGTVINDGHSKYLHSKSDVGYRLSLEAKTSCSCWDANLSWLQFNTSAHRHLNAHDNAHQFYPTQTHPADFFFSQGANAAQMEIPQLLYYINNGTNNSYSSVHGHWQADMDQMDFYLGYALQICDGLMIRPRVGLRSTWIDQKFSVEYKHNIASNQLFQVDPILPAANPLLFNLEQFQSQGDNFKVKKRNNWRGIGPLVSLDTTFNLPCGFNIFGNLGVALEYGRHTTRVKDTLKSSDKARLPVNKPFLTRLPKNRTNIHVKDSYWITHPILDLQLGISWKTCLCGCDLALKAMWEEHIYFGMNQFPNFVDSKSLGTFTTSNSNLSYRGLTVSALVGF